MRTRTARLPKILRRIAGFYPLSLAGSLLLLFAVLILVRGLLIRDPYELVLALLAILVLVLLSLVARLQAAHFSKLHIQWDTSIPLIASTPGVRSEASEPQRLTGISMKPFLWFRLHFVVRGKLRVGREAHLRVFHEFSTAGEEVVPLRFSIPLCGLLEARGILAIGDIFGLTRARFGVPFERRVSVEPAIFPEEITIHVEAAEKTEEKQSQLNSDEDKYYMREYAPGDRFRDINWKTSSRLNQLFTRIAPVALEQTKVIAVELRNYRETAPETLDSVVHLSHLKSWLVSFLRTIKEQNPDFAFQVVTGRGATRLESREDIDRFSDELAPLGYQGDPGVVTEVPQTDEIFIFTTPYDRLLPALLPRYPQQTLSIVRTLSASWQRGATRRQFPLFAPADDLPLPGWWVFRRDGKLTQPGVEQAGARIVAQEVVEARLI